MEWIFFSDFVGSRIFDRYSFIVCLESFTFFYMCRCIVSNSKTFRNYGIWLHAVIVTVTTCIFERGERRLV